MVKRISENSSRIYLLLDSKQLYGVIKLTLVNISPAKKKEKNKTENVEISIICEKHGIFRSTKLVLKFVKNRQCFQGEIIILPCTV